MRVNHVKAARKSPGNCHACGKEIPVGAPYKWVKPRYGGRRIRCGSCAFKASDLITNDKEAALVAACESAREQIAGWDGEDAEGLESILEEAADAIDEVAEQFEECGQNIEDGFQHETEQSQQMKDRAEEIRSFAEDVRGTQIEDYEESPMLEDEGEPEARDAAKEAWTTEQRDAATSALDNCP